MSIPLALAGQNLLSGFPPPCALWLREMYFFRNGACAPGSGAATEDSPPRIREDLRPFAGQIFRSPVSNFRFFFPLSISPWNRFELRIPPNQNLFCKGHDAGGANLYG
jgi:hypothetical protein